MKTRSGFVSNSSSSSFIVGFEAGQNTAEFIKSVVFGGQNGIRYEYGTDFISVDTLVEWVMAELNGKKALDVDDIAEEIMHGYCGDHRMPEYDFNAVPFPRGDVSDKEKKDYHEKSHVYHTNLEIEQRKVALIIAQEFIDNNPGLEYYEMEFGDDTQIGSQLEHGDTFRGLPHMVISKH